MKTGEPKFEQKWKLVEQNKAAGRGEDSEVAEVRRVTFTQNKREQNLTELLLVGSLKTTTKKFIQEKAGNGEQNLKKFVRKDNENMRAGEKKTWT